MSTIGDVRNTLAPGHKATDGTHAPSTYTVTKLLNCEYRYTAGGKKDKTHLTDTPEEDKPGGNNHINATHPNDGKDINGVKWHRDIDTSSVQAYSGFTGSHKDTLINIFERIILTFLHGINISL